MLELSNFVHREITSSLAKGMTNHPLKGRDLDAQLWTWKNFATAHRQLRSTICR